MTITATSEPLGVVGGWVGGGGGAGSRDRPVPRPHSHRHRHRGTPQWTQTPSAQARP
jgi:hypothetical protein